MYRITERDPKTLEVGKDNLRKEGEWEIIQREIVENTEKLETE